MAKKYRFRKVYFVCRDKEVVPANARDTIAYKWESDAVQDAENQTASYAPYADKNRFWKAPDFTVQGFYLVHESLYDEVIEPHQKYTITVIK